jgi:hypothetical protein
MPISAPFFGALAAFIRAPSGLSRPCTANSTSASGPRKRMSVTLAGTPEPGGPISISPGRTQITASPSMPGRALKRPSGPVAQPEITRQGMTCTSEKVSAT